MHWWAKIKDNLHILYALYGMLRYRKRYKKLCIVAITGTDGKSSTVVLTARLLRQAGKKVAHYSSVSIHDGVSEMPNAKKMTTPGRAGLHVFLAKAQENGCAHAVVEITSESVLQWRHFGIMFDVVAYTNITPEHIEHHGSFEKYVAAKLALCDALRSKTSCTQTKQGTIVWNARDAELQNVSERFKRYTNMPITVGGSTISNNPFLEQNVAMAEAIVSVLGVDDVKLSDERLQIPGRFEVFEGPPTVIVDYAHTPHAVELCLKAARALTNGRLIHVFGAAGGGRDTWKRPQLAQLSERYAHMHILTEENSFDEPVADIIADIQNGFTEMAEVHVHERREDAVRHAFSLAKENDVILLTAKGSEEVIAGPRRSMRPYNEREFVKHVLA